MSRELEWEEHRLGVRAKWVKEQRRAAVWVHTFTALACALAFLPLSGWLAVPCFVLWLGGFFIRVPDQALLEEQEERVRALREAKLEREYEEARKWLWD